MSRMINSGVVKTALQAMLLDDNWVDQLLWVILGLRLDFDALLAFKQLLCISGEFLKKNVTLCLFLFS